MQGLWNAFERWERAYTQAALKRSRAMGRSGDWYDFGGDGLFVSSQAEGTWATDKLSTEQVKERIAEKIDFLRDYLVEISFDGAEFMASQSAFLEWQMPDRCEDAFGLWFWQDDLEKDYLTYSTHFSGRNVTLFVASLDQLDFASVRGILGFDRLMLRRPRDEKWTASDLRAAIGTIKRDLAFDGFDCKARGATPSTLVDLAFTWT